MAVIGQLGCLDSLAVYVADRSGEVLLRELPFTAVEYGRVVDDVSEARISLAGANTVRGCCETLNGLVRYGYEIAVYRNGHRAWTGPLVDISSRGNDVELRAEDKFGWTPLAIAVGYRFGNFKPSPVTEAAVREVMIAAGVTPPATIVAKTQQIY